MRSKARRTGVGSAGRGGAEVVSMGVESLSTLSVRAAAQCASPQDRIARRHGGATESEGDGMAKRGERQGRADRRGGVSPWVWGGLAVSAVLALVVFLLARPAPTPIAPPAPPAPSAAVERLVPKVLAVHPHDPTCYTQGLLWQGGALYESCGQYGQSSLRRVDPASGEVRQRVAVPDADFAEGLALVGERLLQLTWREGVALVYDRKTLAKTGQFPYTGEGWGLCFDGRRLVMSDGSDRLTLRDPQTFAVIFGSGELKVTREGVPV